MRRESLQHVVDVGDQAALVVVNDGCGDVHQPHQHEAVLDSRAPWPRPARCIDVVAAVRRLGCRYSVALPRQTPLSRSSQSSSASSSPTDSRSNPSGIRSPSRRYRLSIVELTPPRLVALMITRVRVSTRRGVGDIERDQPRVSGVADELHRGVPAEASRDLGRRLGDAAHAALERVEPGEQRRRRVGRGVGAGQCPHSSQRLDPLGRACHDGAEKGVVTAGQELRPEWITMSAPWSRACR